MIEYNSQVLLQVTSRGKLWNSQCQQSMAIDHDNVGTTMYRCSSPCGQHTVEAAKVEAGLLWHYRGHRANKTYGMSDDQIVDSMLSALHLAWVRDGAILTAQFN